MSLSCQETNCDLKAQEHSAADQDLKLQREKYQQHQIQLEEKLQKLEIRRRNLEEKRARYNKHIQDGKERCQAAHRRAKLELEIVNQKETEIEALQEELKAVKETLQARQMYSRKLIGYQDFLQAAVDKSDGEFETMEDLLSRYYILQQTKKDLQYQTEKILESISASRGMTMQLQQSHTNDLLNSGNKMTKLRETILGNQERISHLEEQLEKLRTERRDKIMEEGTLKLATNNIYHILLQYRNRAGLTEPRQGIVPENDSEEQLVKIAEYINDLKIVTKAVDSEGLSDQDSNSANAVRGSKPPLLV